MTSKYDDTPYYRINKWLTAVLRDEGLVPPIGDYITDLEGDENFALPFMMVSQQSPESATPYNSSEYKSLPFCVWTCEQVGGHDQPWTRHGNITHIFYADDANLLLKISQAVHDLTNREDWAAQDINYFFSNDPTFPFDFKYICFKSGTGPSQQSDEGGRQAYMCIIEYDAVYEGINRPAYDMNDAGPGTSQIGLGRI